MEETTVDHALRVGRQLVGLLEQLQGEVRGETPTGAVMDPSTARTAQLAYEHLAFMDANGGDMTLGDSLAIRRRMFGASVRGTARFFGDHWEDDRASRILYRPDIPRGQRRNDKDPVALTRQGRELAERYRQHVGAAAG